MNPELKAQDAIEYKQLSEIKFKSEQMFTDALLQVYLVRGDKINKYNADGSFCCTFDAKQYGELAYIDVSDPMELVLVYPEFTTIVELDNTLSFISSMEFWELGILQIGAAASSRDNQVWIYDPDEFKIKKINESYEITLQSDDLSRIIYEDLNPNFMLERDSRVFLNDPEIGVMLFDIYATYIKTIPIKGLICFQVRDGQLIYWKDGALRTYNMTSLQDKEISLPGSGKWLSGAIQKDRLYLREAERVLIFGF